MSNILNGYIRLAAAIVNTGIKTNDEVFLKSAWCDYLIKSVFDYNREHNSVNSMNIIDKSDRPNIYI